MATSTTKLGLRKPDPDPTTGDFIDVVTDVNDSMDKLDAAVGTFICTSGTRPVGSLRWDGRDIFETDTRRRYMWSTTVNDWLPILQSRAAAGPYLLGPSTDTTGEGINGQASGSSVAMWKTRVTGDANSRFMIDAAGTINWGGGPASVDVSMSRTAANELSVASGDAFKVSGDYICGSENGVSGVSSGGSDTTTSASYVNMAGAGAVTSFSFTKRWTPTRVRIDMHQILFQNGGSFPFAQLGVRINSVDYDVVGATITAAATNTMFSGLAYIPASAIPAGTYTVQARWKRASGTGTLTRDGGGWLSFSARECN